MGDGVGEVGCVGCYDVRVWKGVTLVLLLMEEVWWSCRFGEVLLCGLALRICILLHHLTDKLS